MASDNGDPDKPVSHHTRRKFVELAGKGAAVAALGGFLRLVDNPKRFIRPPGARPEPEFLALCIRCDKCRIACPYGLLTPVEITESVVSVGTPKLTGSCPGCRRCIPACPTGALRTYRGY